MQQNGIERLCQSKIGIAEAPFFELMLSPCRQIQTKYIGCIIIWFNLKNPVKCESKISVPEINFFCYQEDTCQIISVINDVLKLDFILLDIVLEPAFADST